MSTKDQEHNEGTVTTNATDTTPASATSGDTTDRLPQQKPPSPNSTASHTLTQPSSAPHDPNDPSTFGAYHPTFPVQSYQVPQPYYSDTSGQSIVYAQTPPLGPQGTVSPFPSQSPYLTPVAGGSPYHHPQTYHQSPSLSPSGSATAAQYYFYSQNHTSPFLQAVQMSPTLSAISSAPNSPRFGACPSPTPSFTSGATGTGRGYARSNLSRHAAYDSFISGVSPALAGMTTNVYIRGLPSTTTDEGLHAMCAVFGDIVSSKAIIDAKQGDCKGYGFVMYAREDQARIAINALNAKGFQASFAKESFSARLKNLQDSTSTNIYISNLPLDMDESKLEELFQPYKIVSHRILRDQNGLSRGVGFARMEDRETSLAIIQKFNSFTLPGTSVPLQVRFADSPAQKKLKDQMSKKRIWKGRDSSLSDGGVSPQPGFIPGQDTTNPVLPGVALPPQASMQYYVGGALPPPATGYPGGYTYLSPPQAVPYSTVQTAYYAQQQAPMFSATSTDSVNGQVSTSSVGNKAGNELATIMEQKLQLDGTPTANGSATQGNGAPAVAKAVE